MTKKRWGVELNKTEKKESIIHITCIHRITRYREQAFSRHY